MNAPNTVGELLSMQLTHILSHREMDNLMNIVSIPGCNDFELEFVEKAGCGVNFTMDEKDMDIEVIEMDKPTYTYYKSRGM